MPKPSGELAFSIPFTLGHENAGWVEKLGPGTTGFAVGDPVIVYGPWGCGLCMNCRAGDGELLPTAGRSGGWRPRSARPRNGRVLARSGGTLPDPAGQPRPARRCSAQRPGADELPRHQPFASASRTRVDGRRHRRRRPGPDGDPDIAGTERHDHDVAVDTGPDKLQTARQMGADEALVSGDEAIQRINDITTGQGAELVLDMVSVDRTLQMAAKVSRVLGHLTIVGLGGGALPVNFNSPRNECVVASRFGVGSPSSSTWLTSPRPARSACSSSTSRWNAPARPINSCTTARSRDAPSSHPTTRGVSPDASADADASTPTAGAHAHIEIGYRRFR